MSDDEQLTRIVAAGALVRRSVAALVEAGGSMLYLEGGVDSGLEDAGRGDLRCSIAERDEVICPDCGGGDEECERCVGTGFVRVERRLLRR